MSNPITELVLKINGIRQIEYIDIGSKEECGTSVLKVKFSGGGELQMKRTKVLDDDFDDEDECGSDDNFDYDAVRIDPHAVSLVEASNLRLDTQIKILTTLREFETFTMTRGEMLDAGRYLSRKLGTHVTLDRRLF